MRLAIILLIATLIGTGFFVAWSRLSPTNYAAAIENGISEIELSSEFDILFPNTEHSISYYLRGGAPNWNSQIGLCHRYVLTMQFGIEFDFSRRHPRPITEPRFYLTEIDEIQRGPDGQIQITYTRFQRHFGSDEWNRLISSGGDFGSIGIILNTSEPIEDFDEIWPKS